MTIDEYLFGFWFFFYCYKWRRDKHHYSHSSMRSTESSIAEQPRMPWFPWLVFTSPSKSVPFSVQPEDKCLHCHHHLPQRSCDPCCGSDTHSLSPPFKTHWFGSATLHSIVPKYHQSFKNCAFSKMGIRYAAFLKIILLYLVFFCVHSKSYR